MAAGGECLTAGKGAVDSRPDDVSLRQAPGQGSHKQDSHKQGSRESDCAEVSCAFCHGTGTDPFGILSWLSQCCVCDGKGVTQVQGPQESCAHCRGSGAIKTFTCTVCGGKGLVPLRAGDTAVCPECQGTGDDVSASAMACLKCRGRGWVVLNA
jgi:DnaJ-class molecular chaperone